jgi:predicted nucleic acid-binding protein
MESSSCRSSPTAPVDFVVIYDTNFLVTLAGQNKRIPRARALAFLAVHDGAAAYISRISAVEFAAGFDSAAHAARYLAPFTVLAVDDRIWDSATGIFRDLRRAGLRIGLPDTLIAATALDYGLPLVTDNAEHFKRVRGLKVYTF